MWIHVAAVAQCYVSTTRTGTGYMDFTDISRTMGYLVRAFLHHHFIGPPSLKPPILDTGQWLVGVTTGATAVTVPACQKPNGLAWFHWWFGLPASNLKI